MVKYYRNGSEMEYIRQNHNFDSLANIQNHIQIIIIGKEIQFAMEKKKKVISPIKIHAFLPVHTNTQIVFLSEDLEATVICS